MSIGEFARRSRLSAKALRLYDQLGLLVPARMDDVSGYRFYEEAQLDQARLIAALRQLGVPLAQIEEMLPLGPDEVAGRIAGLWRVAEEQHAARQRTGHSPRRPTPRKEDHHERSSRPRDAGAHLALLEAQRR
jgi:DNA-binding transcriptional MerR regulator